MDTRLFTLISCDGLSVEVPCEVARHMEMAKAILDVSQDEEEYEPLLLPQVNGKWLTKMVDFIKHYLEEPYPELLKPLRAMTVEELVPEWYGTFFKDMTWKDLEELVGATNFVDARCITTLVTAKMASLLKHKTMDEVRDIIGFHRELTEEEKAEALREQQLLSPVSNAQLQSLLTETTNAAALAASASAANVVTAMDDESDDESSVDEDMDEVNEEEDGDQGDGDQGDGDQDNGDQDNMSVDTEDEDQNMQSG